MVSLKNGSKIKSVCEVSMNIDLSDTYRVFFVESSKVIGYKALSLIYRKSTNMLFFDHTWWKVVKKIQIIHSIIWSLVHNITNITFVSYISCKIWIYFKIDGQILSKNSFLAGFLQIRDGASAGWYLSL